MLLYVVLIILIIILVYIQKDDLFNEDLVIVSSHYKEDLEWLNSSSARVEVCDKKGSNRHPFGNNQKCSMGYNFGREAASFLKYIVEHYDSLPKYIAFIHGHEEAWHQPSDLLNRIRRCKKEKHDYISLNNMILITQGTDKFKLVHNEPIIPNHKVVDPYLWAEITKAWPKVFEPVFKNGIPPYTRYVCCSQFVVSRDAIRKHPKKLYEGFYEWVSDVYGDDYIRGIFMEMVWEPLFTGIHSFDICEKIPNCNMKSYESSRFN